MSAVIRFFDSKVIEWIVVGTYAYFCLIILVEVVRRHLFGASSAWGEMTARYAFVYLTYVAAAEAIRYGRHIRIDIVPNKASPRVRKWLDLYTDALTVFLAGIIVYYSLELMGIQWSFNIVMTAADINMAFAQAALPLGWMLIILRIAQNWLHRSNGVRASPDTYMAD